MSIQDDLPESCIELDRFLRKEGFKCTEQNTAEPTRWRYYSREFRDLESNVMLRLVLRFELVIHDDPFGSYDDNHELYYNDSYFAVYDRQMLVAQDQIFAGDHFYDEETEELRKIDRFPLRFGSYEEVKRLVGVMPSQK